jgi:hypothetical protein
MTDETLKLLQNAIRQKGGSLSSISTAAIELCRIVDRWNTLHWADRNRLTAENKALHDRIAKLENGNHLE